MFTGRVVLPGEPLWTEEDVDYALAWQREQNALCKGCGHPVDETGDKVNTMLYAAEETWCQGCAVIEWRRKALSDSDIDLSGVRLHVTKKARPDYA